MPAGAKAWRAGLKSAMPIQSMRWAGRAAAGEDIVARRPGKNEFPVDQVRRYLEPGPIVLVSSRWRGKANIIR
jgi:hypothetical protein